MKTRPRGQGELEDYRLVARSTSGVAPSPQNPRYLSLLRLGRPTAGHKPGCYPWAGLSRFLPTSPSQHLTS